MKKINILGTEWTIRIDDFNCEELKGKNRCGYCFPIKKLIVTEDLETDEDWKNESDTVKECRTKEIIRHEIIHAFLYESGLHASTSDTLGGWSMNEEMIDWIAIQSPKIFNAFKEADAI